MKRIVMLLTVLAAALLMSPKIYADMSEYKEEISSQLSASQTDGIADELNSLGIDPDEPESVSNIRAEKLLEAVFNIFSSALKRPVKISVICIIIAAISRLAMTLSNKAGLYSEMFVMLCFIAISSSVIYAFTSALDAMKGCHAFMIGYIPAFAGIVASSGNITAAISYNAIVFYFCEGAAWLATSVFQPILACMLVLSAAQAINPDLSGLTASVKNALTTLVGFVMTLFLGVLSLQTIVGRGTDGLAVRAGKYAVSSFIPIIGYSLSESYKAVSLSLSAIRTTVGVFGIIVICLYMLSPIVVAAVYKVAFIISGWACRLIGAWNISQLMSGLSDVFGFLGTVLTVFMLMVTVSTGMLILLGGELLA